MKTTAVFLTLSLFVAVADAGWKDKYINDDFKAQILADHNAARAMHGAAPLVCNNKAAKTALKWAKKMVKAKTMEHSSGSGYGENLYMTMRSSGKYATADTVMVAERTVASWYDELNNYNFATGEKKDSTKATGHFTQVVWGSTTGVGCAFGSFKNDWYNMVVVCNYTPPGNYGGQYTTEVAVPTGCYQDDKVWCPESLMCVDEDESC